MVRTFCASQRQRQLLGHAHGAERLLGVVDHLGRHLGGEDLDHRGFHAHVAALVLLDRGVHHHQAAGMQLGRGVGDPPLDGLAVGELLAEGHALVGVLDHHVERALGHADAPRAHLQAAHGEAKLHGREARADPAQHLALVHAAVLEHDLVGALAGQHRDGARDHQALGALVDQEGGDAAARAAFGIGHRHDDGEVGLGDAADPDLAAVDHPVVAVLHRAASSCRPDRRPRPARRWRWPRSSRRRHRARGTSCAAPV